MGCFFFDNQGLEKGCEMFIESLGNIADTLIFVNFRTIISLWVKALTRSLTQQNAIKCTCLDTITLDDETRLNVIKWHANHLLSSAQFLRRFQQTSNHSAGW